VLLDGLRMRALGGELIKNRIIVLVCRRYKSHNHRYTDKYLGLESSGFSCLIIVTGRIDTKLYYF